MATAETSPAPHDRHPRKRPFATWMKRLANLKSSHSDSANSSSKKANGASAGKAKKSAGKNNPYPESGHMHRPAAGGSGNGHLSFSEPVAPSNGSYTSLEENGGPRRVPTTSNKSAAPTLATNAETINSDAGYSKAGTSNTVGGGMSSRTGGGNSTFSSPNHSERSLTTTLTTIQSTAPSGLLQGNPNAQQNGQNLTAPVQFSHQYPISPASAVPPHLQPNPNTYSAATANNMLTDNASILTLASSSKRRRRHSLDTNASVRALAPSSLWGGSRESLPLSVLSSNVEASSSTTPTGIYQSQNRPSVGGLASAERASIYSSSGVAAPALSSERNSYYANKTVDGGSVRSGLLGHGRTESVSGSVGAAGSPLASPRESTVKGTLSRWSSDWKERDGDVSDGESLKRSEKENEAVKSI